jgi:cytochrome P450
MSTDHSIRYSTDFDHHAPEHVLNSVETYRQMRAEAPVTWSNEHGGFWVVTRYDDVMELTRSPDNFSSAKHYNGPESSYGGVTIPTSKGTWLVPVETDLPDWTRYRMAMAPLLTPKGVAQLIPVARSIVDELIDHVIKSGEIDLVEDLANPLPSLMTMYFLGLPLTQWRRFTSPFQLRVSSPLGSEGARRAAEGQRWIEKFVRDEIALRRTEPAPGLISHMMEIEIFAESSMSRGPKLDDEEIFLLAMTAIGAGVDTITGLMTNALMHLHRNHDDRDRLAANPKLRQTACEEFLRYFTPVQALARTATKDMVLGGCEISKGDRMLFAFASANRDENEFTCPEQLDVARFPNRHLGFGIGRHRCVGSTFARMMFDVVLSAVLDRIPDYAVIEDVARHYPIMPTVNGWHTMPARFTPGRRKDASSYLPAWDDFVAFA